MSSRPMHACRACPFTHAMAVQFIRQHAHTCMRPGDQGMLGAFAGGLSHRPGHTACGRNLQLTGLPMRSLKSFTCLSLFTSSTTFRSLSLVVDLACWVVCSAASRSSIDMSAMMQGTRRTAGRRVRRPGLGKFSELWLHSPHAVAA